MGVVQNREDRHFLDNLSPTEHATLRQRSVAIQDAGYPLRGFSADGLSFHCGNVTYAVREARSAPYFWLGAESEELR